MSGTSMLPALRADEVVRLEPVDDVRPGHVLAFERGGGLLVHRVVRVASGHVVCRGDNRIEDDGSTPRTALVGRAVAVFGPGRGRGMRLRDDHRALLWVELRRAGRRLGAQARHLGAETALVVRQARGRGRDRRSTSADLSGLEAESRGAPAPSEPPALPAALYSSLAADERVALVRAALQRRGPGAETRVFALAVSPEHRLARVGTAVRLGLRHIGIDAGEPGDATWPTADCRAHVAVHLFTADQLTAELERAGARVLEVRADTVRRTRVWRATIVS